MELAQSTKRHGSGLSIAYCAGMILVFVGQRALTQGPLAWSITAFGCFAVVVATGLRFSATRKAAPNDRSGQRTLLILSALGLAALLAYLVTSDLMLLTLGTSLERHSPTLASALATLWPALWLIGTLPIVSIELAYRSMRRAPVFDQGRIAVAMRSGLGVAFALVFATALVYSGRITEAQVDLSYFRTTKPGESTLNIVRALNQPLTVTTFFPLRSDVGKEVSTYTNSLKSASPFLKVEQLDHALEPARGRELSVTGNGVIVFSRGGLRRELALSLEPERSRAGLRKLDENFNAMLLNVTRPARRIYFTQGHGERVFKPVNETDRRSTLFAIKENLSTEGYEVLEFSIANGLGAEVPSDAAALMVVGPMSEFLPDEARSVVRFVKERGGSLLVALDAEVGREFPELLEPFSLIFQPTSLANEVAYWQRTGQTSDRVNIATVSFGSHVSVATLAKLGFQAPVIFMGAGSLLLPEGAKPQPEVTIQTDANTWADRNSDFQANPNEMHQTFALAAAVSFPAEKEHREGRLVVLSDADALCDIALQNSGNKTLFQDSLRWLSRDEALGGEIKSEEDIPINHSRKQDLAWFYLTSFVPPVLLVVAGILFTRRRRRGRARDEHAKSAGPQAEKQPTVEHQEAV